MLICKTKDGSELSAIATPFYNAT